MDSSNYGPFIDLCRICVKSKRNNAEITEALKYMLKKHLFIDVEEEDKQNFFPKLMCKQCIGKLQDFHSLYLTAKTTNALLTAELRTKIGRGEKAEIVEQEIDPNLLQKNEELISLDTISFDAIIKNEPITEDFLHVEIKAEELFDPNQGSVDEVHDTKDACKEHDENGDDTNDTQESHGSVSSSSDAGNPLVNSGPDEEHTYNCPQCKRKCKSEESLQTHMRVHQGLKPFQCPTCSKSYTKRSNLTRHIANRHTVQPDIVCSHDNCGLIFHKNRSYQMHVRAKHMAKPTPTEGNDEFDFMQLPEKVYRGSHACSKCPRRFKTEELLSIHMRTHQGLKRFPCPQCDAGYAKRARLTLHISEVHTDNPKEYKCPYPDCGRVFNKKDGFGNHLRTRHSKKPIDESSKAEPRNSICEECGKAFKCLWALRQHRYTHGPPEERPLKCDQCDSRFVSRRALRIHKLRHAGIKNYECPHCGLKKTTLTELKTHINCHTKEKQWQCHLCPLVFNSSTNLKRHDRIVHRAIRDFKCQYCDLSFGKKETLVHHERRHNGEKPHKCPLCERGFIQAVSLKTHLKTHAKRDSKRTDDKKDDI